MCPSFLTAFGFGRAPRRTSGTWVRTTSEPQDQGVSISTTDNPWSAGDHTTVDWEEEERQIANRQFEEMVAASQDSPEHIEYIKGKVEARSKLVTRLSANWKIVDNIAGLKEMGQSLVNLPTWPPSLYMDGEGIKMSRNGTLTSLAIFVRPTNAVFILDVQILQHTAFNTSFQNGQTLRQILEDQAIPICFWDARKDSDVLYHLFGIHLGGIIDVQLMEVRGRTNRDPQYTSPFRVAAYGSCVNAHIILDDEEKQLSAQIKEFGRVMFQDNHWDLLTHRPMLQDVVLYCALDVHHMAALFDVYRPHLSNIEFTEVLDQSTSRVDQCFESADVQRQRAVSGYHPSISPWAWRQPVMEKKEPLTDKHTETDTDQKHHNLIPNSGESVPNSGEHGSTSYTISSTTSPEILQNEQNDIQDGQQISEKKGGENDRCEKERSGDDGM